MEASLRDFSREAWRIVEPGREMVSGWHLDAISEHLEAITSGEILSLIINIPPRFMKSLSMSVFWPVWMWISKPGTRFLFASYAQSLSTRDAVKSRRLIQSPWFQDRWGDRFQLTSDQNEKIRYDNNKTGYRISTSVKGIGTGEGGDILAIDDPHKTDDVHSDTIREGVLDWWSESWSSRKNDQKTSGEVITMQRLHERDLTAYALAEDGEFVHLRIPNRFEADRKCITKIGWEDPRTKEGELLWPERVGMPETIRLEKRLGEYGKAGQLQQRPAPAEGGIFKKVWWKFWYPADIPEPEPYLVRKTDGEWFPCGQVQIPAIFDAEIQSWDMAFKDTKGSAFVVGQAWGRLGADAFLKDQERDKMNFPATCDTLIAFSFKHPLTAAKFVEDKANGPAVIDTLKRKIPGLIPVDPEGDKTARAHAVSPFVQSGNVYLPHPKIFPWVLTLLGELTSFPNSAYKDQVDALTQAVRKLIAGTITSADEEIDSNRDSYHAERKNKLTEGDYNNDAEIEDSEFDQRIG